MHNNKDQTGHPVRPHRFWIIGAGRFGQIAVDRISRHIPGASITVVDKQAIAFEDAGIGMICQDGIQWLAASLDENASVDLIVPAIPVHVAAAWLKLTLKRLFEINSVAIPDAWLSQMPHAYRGATGQAFVSHADFICPDNCPEPREICTHTGKTRPLDLFRLLSQLDFDNVLPIVLRSYQLLPGVGGVYPADLLTAQAAVCNNSCRPLMIATACRCHGVVDFIRLVKKPAPAEPG
ncbi:potassium transporter [Desulfosarcina sp.]|uniref:potassium transporter n=1 Tax=Desulfosarcina sp. TaxID=2027861 RepID=UPI003970CC57